MTARPPKPWERQGGATTSALASGSASDGSPKPWERPAGDTTGATFTTASTSAPSTALTNRSRPWQALGSSSPYGGQYGSAYNSSPYSSYGSTSYGSAYGGGAYGNSMYGNNSYGSGYGSSMFGRPMGGYGSSTYGQPYGAGGYGGSYGGYGSNMGGYGGGFGGGYGGPGPLQGPYDAANPPPPPPSGWQAMLHAIGGIVGFFGRLSFLIDENAHAVHFFVSALLQMLDRAGSLYGELARFVLRLIGYKSKEQKPVMGPHAQSPQQSGGSSALALPQQQQQQHHHHHHLPHAVMPAAAGSSNWDTVWQS